MADTAAALASLQIAKGYYDRLLDDSKLTPNQQLDCIKFAAHHLASARAADPSATLQVETQRGAVTYTQEFLASQVLYFQAMREAALDDEKGCLKALETLKQASIYAPDRAFIHRAIADVLLKLFQREQAITAAQFALALDPSDMDSRMLVDKITTTASLGIREKIPGRGMSAFGWNMWKLGMVLTFIAPFALGAIGASDLIVGSIIIGLILAVVGGKFTDWGNSSTYLHNALRKDHYR